MASQMQELAARLMDEARDRVQPPGDTQLAKAIQPLVGHLYGRQAVSGWATGRINVPGFVLLAACKVTKISIDEALFGESYQSQLDELERRLGEVERRQSAR